MHDKSRSETVVKVKPTHNNQFRINRIGTHMVIVNSSGKRKIVSQQTIRDIGSKAKGGDVILTEGLSKAQVGRIANDIQISASKPVVVKKLKSSSSTAGVAYSIKIKEETRRV